MDLNVNKYLLVCFFFFSGISYADLNKIYPITIDPTSAQLPQRLRQQWQEQGFCLIDGLLNSEQVHAIRDALTASFGPTRINILT